MKTYKVNKNEAYSETYTLQSSDIRVSGDSIYVKFADNRSNEISVGDSILFTKLVDSELGLSCNAESSVECKISDTEFVISVPVTHENITMGYEIQDEWPGYGIAIFSEQLNISKSDIAAMKRQSDKYDLVTFEMTNIYNGLTYKADKIEIDSLSLNRYRVFMDEDKFNNVRRNGTYIKVNHNEFFAIDKDGVCSLWNDVSIHYNSDAISLNIGLSEKADFNHLNQEYNINKIYEENYKADIIPSIINLEKVKYSPMIVEEDEDGNILSCKDVETINIIPHFRVRQVEKAAVGTNIKLFKDGWYVDDDASSLWFSFKTQDDISLNSAEYLKADLIGDLSFSDNDVKYQKSKLKKSFFRLSFYEENTPITNSLLYYSTVFLDSNSLYSKYNKLKNEVNRYDGTYVFYQGEGRLDSKVTITNAYNLKKSSEGFYLYLFKDDAPKENEVKTIYMKVEFNHARYGRTIPMVKWPMNGNKGADLTVENFFDCIYIPVKLSYYNNRYIYWFPNAYNQERIDNTVNIVLFEPKIES